MKDSSPLTPRPAHNVCSTKLPRAPAPRHKLFCAECGRYPTLLKVSVLVEDARSEAFQLVNAGAEQLLHAGHKSLAEVRIGSPRRVISECAKALQADLIMVGSHGHSALSRFLLGSVAQAVLRIGACPVEIVRFPAGGAARHPIR